MHEAHFSADTSHYKENECMRLAMEDVLYDAGIDIVLNGHCHEYERSNAVYVSCCLCIAVYALLVLHFQQAVAVLLRLCHRCC